MIPYSYDSIPLEVARIQAQAPKPMVAFHGSETVKSFYLGRLKMHHANDDFIKRTYWENGRGCAIGCTLHSSNHSSYPDELGFPEWLGHLVDTLFENLPNGKSKDFAVRSAEAIPVGSNLEPVKWRFYAFLMGENLDRVELLSISDDLKNQVKDAISKVKDLHEQAAQTGKIDELAAAVARSTAAAAAAEWSVAARSAAYIRCADKLLELLAAAS